MDHPPTTEAAPPDHAAAPAQPARRWLATALVLALLSGMVAYLAGTDEGFASVRRLSARVLAATCVIQFASQLFLNGSLLLPLQTAVTRLGFWELYLVRTGGLLVGSFLPVAGGLAVRLAYLRHRGLTYVDFAWATLLSNLLALGAAAVLSVLATTALWILAGQPPAPVLGISAGVLAVSAAALAVFEYLPRLTRHPRFSRWQWLSAMGGRRTSPSLAQGVFVLSLLRHVCNFVTFGALAQSLSGVRGDFLSAGLLYALTSPVRMVNITPGNLGVTEWVVAVVGKALAFDIATGLIVAIVFRGVSLVGQAIGVLVGSAWLAWQRRP